MNNEQKNKLMMASEVVFQDHTLPKMQETHIWKWRRQKVFFTEGFAEEISGWPGPVYFDDANSA